MNGRAPRLLLDGAEELGARASAPIGPLCAVDAPGWHVPGRREGAEMIQPNHVHVGQQRAQAVDAPAISAPTKRVPVVDGVAPELPFRAEVVGRHPGDDRRLRGRCRARTARGWPRRRSSRARRRTADRRSSARPCHGRAAARRSAWRSSRNWAKRTSSIRSASSRRAVLTAGRLAPDQLGRPVEVAWRRRTSPSARGTGRSRPARARGPGRTVHRLAGGPDGPRR